MAVKGKSARGELVDFDLLKIKEQIATAPPSSEVKRRKDFIENKLRRRPKQVPKSIPVVEVDTTPPQVAEPVKEDIVVKKADIETNPPVKKTTKQKARQTKKQDETNENDTSSTE